MATVNMVNVTEFALMVDTVNNPRSDSDLKYTTPQNYGKARRTEEWTKAMEEEYDALIANNT